ncbi:MAG: hypothetical protein DRR06_18250 [Gammaproteobacteria bacterium]|nr:MAG: hypothetical protein DRR06_18250 [Gammaproteobacteria bacterium]
MVTGTDNGYPLITFDDLIRAPGANIPQHNRFFVTLLRAKSHDWASEYPLPGFTDGPIYLLSPRHIGFYDVTQIPTLWERAANLMNYDSIWPRLNGNVPVVYTTPDFDRRTR